MRFASSSLAVVVPVPGSDGWGGAAGPAPSCIWAAAPSVRPRLAFVLAPQNMQEATLNFQVQASLSAQVCLRLSVDVSCVGFFSEPVEVSFVAFAWENVLCVQLHCSGRKPELGDIQSLV